MYSLGIIVPTVGFGIEIIRDRAVELAKPDGVVKDGNNGWILTFNSRQVADRAREELLSLFQSPNMSQFGIDLTDVVQIPENDQVFEFNESYIEFVHKMKKLGQ